MCIRDSYYIPLILFCICFIWRFFHITDRDICLDEPFTIFQAQKSIYNIILLTIHGEPTPPLFMIMVHVWIKLFGFSALALRTLPLIFSSLTVIFIYRSVLKLTGVYAALISSALLLFSSMHFFFGLEIRTYSLMSLLTAIIYYLYIIWIQNPKNKWIPYLIVLANIGLLLSNYFGLLVIVNEGIILLFYFKNHLLRKKIVTVIFATLILSSPILYLLFKQYLVSSKGTWVPALADGSFQYFIELALNGRDNINHYVYILTACFSLFVFRALKNKNCDFSDIKILFIWLFCFLFPYLSMFFLSFSSPCFLERYLLFNSIALYLFIGITIGKLLESYSLFQAIALIIVTTYAYKNMFINSKDFYYRDLKNAVNYTLENKDNQTLVFIQPAWNVIGFAYHYKLSRFNNTDDFVLDILNAENIFAVYSFDEASHILKRKWGNLSHCNLFL